MNNLLRVSIIFLLHAPIFSQAQTDRDSILNEIVRWEKKVLDHRYVANDSMLIYAKNQLSLAEKLNDSIQIGKAYLSVGIANNNLGINQEDLKYLIKSRQLFEELKNDSLQALATLELISLYKEAKSIYFQPDSLLHVIKREFERTNAKELLARTYLELGLIYRNPYRAGESRDSIPYYYNQSIAIAESIPDARLVNAATNNIADYYLLKPQMNLDTVIYLSNRVIDSEDSDAINKCIAYLNKAEALKKLKDPGFLKFLEIGYELSEQVRPTRIRSAAAKQLYEFYNDSGNYELALKYYQVYTSRKNTAKGTYERMLFENLNKEVVIKEQQRVLFKSDLVKQRNLIYLLIFGFLTLLTFSIVTIKKNKIIKHKNSEIKKKKEHIEWLLKEVHHRVKNNLQMIVGLLDLQQSSVKNEEVSVVLNDAGSRVKSVALIHQNLYRGDTDMVTVGFQKYVEELVDNLLYSYNMLQKVDVSFDIDELEIPFDKGVIFGLLITELVTNVLKHAFPGNSKGKLSIAIKHNENRQQVLVNVKDNGIGLPDDFNAADDSFGLDLIATLVKDLNGEIQFANDNGTRVTINLSKFIN